MRKEQCTICKICLLTRLFFEIVSSDSRIDLHRAIRQVDPNCEILYDDPVEVSQKCRFAFSTSEGEAKAEEILRSLIQNKLLSISNFKFPAPIWKQFFSGRQKRIGKSKISWAEVKKTGLKLPTHLFPNPNEWILAHFTARTFWTFYFSRYLCRKFLFFGPAGIGFRFFYRRLCTNRLDSPPLSSLVVGLTFGAPALDPIFDYEILCRRKKVGYFGSVDVCTGWVFRFGSGKVVCIARFFHDHLPDGTLLPITFMVWIS